MSKSQKFSAEVTQDEDFPRWYKDTITKGELLDYHDINGCYALRPNAMVMWNVVKEHFTRKIEQIGVREAYFPLLVSKQALEKEKEHIADFAPEVAWITECGGKKLENPVAIRPTSETIIYPYFAKWIHSHRDLPMKVNQWCNVLRWETTQTMPFIRGREILWQEGHTAHLLNEEADREVYHILELYAEVYEHLLAVPVIRGKKSRKETFAGAEYTTTVEAFIPATGKGVQGATSHSLGTNFSRMFDIKVEDPKNPGNFVYAYQNSWGLTTRSLGVCILTHSDNHGLVLPPNIAPVQVVVVVCGVVKSVGEEEKKQLFEAAVEIEKELEAAKIRVKSDLTQNTTPGQKFNHWEVRGVPLRIEIGPKDMKKKEASVVWRSDRTRKSIPLEGITEMVRKELATIQSTMYHKARTLRDAALVSVSGIEELMSALKSKKMAYAQWCGEEKCEESIKARTTEKDEEGKVVAVGAKTLCIPFHAPVPVEGSCIGCAEKSSCIGLFGRCY